MISQTGANESDHEALLAFSASTVILCISMCLHFILVVAITLPLIVDAKKRTRAASFNLYLAVLSSVELFYDCVALYSLVCAYRSVWKSANDWTTILQVARKAVEKQCKWTMLVPFFVSPVVSFMVAFLCYEILELLRNSQKRKRCKPPSLRKLGSQVIVAFAFGIVGSLQSYTKFYMETDDWPEWKRILRRLFFITVILGPITYDLWVVYRVVKEGLMSTKANVGNRLSVVVEFLARILFIYVFMLGATWAIGLVLAQMFEESKILVLHFVAVFWGLTGWSVFAVILRKPDVWMMVRGLFVCELCLRKQKNSATKHKKITKIDENTRFNNEEYEDDEEDEDKHEYEDKRKRFVRSNRIKALQEIIAGVEDYLSDEEEDEEILPQKLSQMI